MSLRNSSGQVYEKKISEINAKILMQKKKTITKWYIIKLGSRLPWI